jgi:WD40 repeat protein
MSIDEASGIMYTGDTDGIICSWDLSTGTALQRFQSTDVTMMHKLHTGTISALTFVNGKLLSAGWDDTIRITDGKDQHIQEVKVDAQPNAISHGTDLVVIMTVAGILLLKGKYENV